MARAGDLSVNPGGWRGEGAIVFGGSGFLGTSILRLFPDMVSVGRTRPVTGNRHIQIDDLGDLSALGSQHFDSVLFCVGTSRHHELMQQPMDAALDAHLRPFVRVVEQLKSRPIRSFVRLSTLLLTANDAALPVDEQSPIDPFRNRYLMSQYFGEQAALFLSRETPIATLRLTNTYGPWPLPRTDFVHQIVHQLHTRGSAEIASRAPERDFVFVEDAARAMAGLAHSGATGLFVLGSGEATSTGAIADLLQEITGRPVTSREEPAEGIARLCVNSAKLRQSTGWAPLVTLEHGLRRTWDEMHAAGH